MKLKPGTADLKQCPGAAESMELLNELRDGQAIFGFEETMDAGLPAVQPADPNRLVTPDVVLRASRLFPSYGIGNWSGRDG